MWTKTKAWLVNKCWDTFHLDKLKTRSKIAMFVLGIALLVAVAALIVGIVAVTKQTTGEIVLVPKERLVQINDRLYIPVQIV